MYIGQKFKMLKTIRDDFHKTKSQRKWVNAELSYIPSHGRFISFRLSFRNGFGQLESYNESFTVWEMARLMSKGEMQEA